MSTGELPTPETDTRSAMLAAVAFRPALGHTSSMSQAEITAALAAVGVHLDPWDEMFRDGKRPLDHDEVCALLTGASDDEIASWAEAEAFRQRRYDRMVV